MATKIEWTDETFNPQVGCNRYCKGCDKCYAIRMANRLQAQGYTKYQGVVHKNHKDELDWTGKINFAPKVLSEGVRSLSAPSMIFVNSMSDTFHRDVSDDQIDWYINQIKYTPQHVYQVLTKRHERIAQLDKELPENMWLGVSVCSKSDLKAIDGLRSSSAKVKFLSLEPLIEDLGVLNLGDVDWVIVGGESGPSAREMDPDWVRSIRDQCVSARVPLFFKQWGTAHAEWQIVEGKRKRVKQPPMIDGKYWLQFPTDHPAVNRKRRAVIANYPRSELAPYRVRA